MIKLPKEDIILKLQPDGKGVIASLFENGGYRYWRVYQFSELPNDLITTEDLERFGINLDIVRSKLIEVKS